MLPAIRYTFTVNERLKREQHIKTLFLNGKAFSSFPLKCIWLPLDRGSNELSPVRIGVSVAKKKMPHATDRQRAKRLMREAWRLHKHELYACIPPQIQLHIFMLMTASAADMPDYEQVAKAVRQIIATLAKQFPKD